MHVQGILDIDSAASASLRGKTNMHENGRGDYHTERDDLGKGCGKEGVSTCSMLLALFFLFT
jgi:hypothetical protein